MVDLVSGATVDGGSCHKVALSMLETTRWFTDAKFIRQSPLAHMPSMCCVTASTGPDLAFQFPVLIIFSPEGKLSTVF